MSALKNILLVGANGSIGSVVLKALLEEPSFNITILQRVSSSKLPTLPTSVKIVTAPDSYPEAELITIFKGQDVVINCITSVNVSEQFRFIDAAIAAGVRRYVPSEYGLNNLRRDAQALNHVFADKGRVQEYLRARTDKIEWMSISCGMWLKWSMKHSFLGMQLLDDDGVKRFNIWDDGEGYFSCTTEENTALALVRALTWAPEETKNTNVYISDFAITQNQLLAELEKQLNTKLEVKKIDSAKLIKEKQEAVKNGDEGAVYALIETGFVTGRYGGHLEKEADFIWNKKLGLPEQNFHEVVAAGIKALKLI